MTTEIDGLIAEVAAARRRVMADIAGVTEERATWQPAPGEWSVAQVIEHLVLAEHSGIIRMWQAVVGLQRGEPVWRGEPVHRGKSIEQNIAETWREREVAPRTPRRRRTGHWRTGSRRSPPARRWWARLGTRSRPSTSKW
jgi:hypothetical protein